MSEVVSCVGVVLAGGNSVRMGMEKASLRIGGETLLARIVRRLRLALPEVIVVGPVHLEALVPNTPVFPDETPGAGPLGGLATALAHVKSQHVFVVGCDMPFIEPELVDAMARYAMDHPEADVVALRAARGVEPLHAIYGRSCQLPVRDLLASRAVRSLASLLKRLRVEELPTCEVARYDPAARSTFNANAPEEWREALAIYAQETSS